uniref:Uncharacterized protein n=1 Tax=viral metagenome TaxID=1070528 RepID=A0A6M3IXM3_9ZZZZ
MIVYKDMTFCDYYKKCAEKNCKRALTAEIGRKADSIRLPICHFIEKPPCFSTPPHKGGE